MDQANGDQMQRKAKVRPVAPPSWPDKESKTTHQSDQAPTDDSKQNVQRSQLGALQKSLKQKSPTFISYVGQNPGAQDKPEDSPPMKSPAGKQVCLSVL